MTSAGGKPSKGSSDEHEARLNRERQKRFREQREAEIAGYKAKAERYARLLHNVRMSAMDFADKPETWLSLDDEQLTQRIEAQYAAMATKAQRSVKATKTKPPPKKSGEA